jgi:hypothetical protein
MEEDPLDGDGCVLRVFDGRVRCIRGGRPPREGSCSLEREALARLEGGCKMRKWCGNVCMGVREATLAVRDRDGLSQREGETLQCVIT